jgi:ADP-heptose:LPS heptosyltransferase
MIVSEYIKLLYYLVNPDTIFLKSPSKAIGDNLLMTGLIPNLKKRNPKKKIIVETKHKDLFINNHDIYWVTSQHFKTTSKFIRPRYKLTPDFTKSIYLQLMEAVGFQFASYPKLYLQDKEITEIKSEFDYDYIAIAPFGKQKYSRNRKEWGFDRFQQVVDAFPNLQFIQIGMANDQLLKNVVDARGRRIRESALIIYNSLFFLGLEGGLMHLSKAVGKRSVIIYGGLVARESSAYIENINIDNPISCSPCFRTRFKFEDCPSMECMADITPEIVITQVKNMLISIQDQVSNEERKLF